MNMSRKEDYYGENGGVVFPNPNAPTGILMPLSEIEDIIAHNRNVIVVVDEAYIDFGGESALPLIEKYDNLLVVQTFSKSRSLAGMRLGFAMGNEKLIRYINDVKYSFNSYTLNQTALSLGVQAIKDREYFEETCAKVIATREWTKCELKKLGFSFGDSMSNFIFATHERVPAKEIFEKGGLLLSEYLFGVPAYNTSFVERDRLQAGLAIATIVIQTGIKGGTMHAVRTTINNNKILAVVNYKEQSVKCNENVAGNELLISRGSFSLRKAEVLFEFLQQGGVLNYQNDELRIF